MQITGNKLIRTFAYLGIGGGALLLQGSSQNKSNETTSAKASQDVSEGEETLKQHYFMVNFKDSLSVRDIAERLKDFKIYEDFSLDSEKNVFYVGFDSNETDQSLQKKLEGIDGIEYVGLNAPFTPLEVLREKRKDKLNFLKAVTEEITKPQVEEKHTDRVLINVLPVSFEQIVARSNRIFAGVCTKVEKGVDEKDITRFTFKITEGVKGVDGKNEISFRQYNQTSMDYEYEAGKKYILFLSQDSEIGLTAPIGLHQGRFEVHRNDKGKESAVSYKGNTVQYQEFVKSIRDILRKEEKSK